MEIYKSFTFESAHSLPNVPEGHKCARLHGHSYRVTFHLEGDLGETSGWVTDFADIGVAVRPVIDQIDHYYLNEIPGLENPTAEILAMWIWDRVIDALPQLSAVAVAETCTSGCTYRGPNA